MYNVKQIAQLNEYTVTDAKNRIFTTYGKDENDAIDYLAEYVYCEYDETLVIKSINGKKVSCNDK